MAKATYLLRKASELVRARRYQDAVEVYLQATETDPGDSRAWFGLGVCLYRIGNLDVARIALERAQQMGYPKAEEALARVSAAEQRRATEGTGAKATVAPAEAEKRAAQRPAVSARPPRPAVRSEEEKLDLDRFLRVMLVENKEMDRRAITQAIEGTIKHCEVTSVPYGVSTSETMSGTVHYDVAVLDWDMAPDSAAGLIQILKIKRPNLFIVALTESWDPESAVEILEAGADYHLVKEPHFASVVPLALAQWSRRDRAVAEQQVGSATDSEPWPPAVQAVGEPLMLVDADFTIMQANQAAMKAFRRGEEEFIGRSYARIFYDAEEPPDTCPVLAVLEHGEPASKTVEPERLGIAFEVQVWPVLTRASKIGGAVVLLKEAAALAGVSEELKAREQLYRALAERANAGIVLVGPDGKLEFVNRGFCTLLDQTEDELLGRPIETVVSVEDQESLRECLETALEQGVAGGRLVLQRESGAAFPAEARLARFAAGEGTSLVLTLVEVGELEQAEQELWTEASKFSGILESGIDRLDCGVVVLDHEGRVTWLNGLAAHVFDAEKDELQGADYLQVARERLGSHVGDVDAFLQTLSDAHDGGETLADCMVELAAEGETLRYCSTPVESGPSSVSRVEHFYLVEAGAAAPAGLQADEKQLVAIGGAVPEMLFTTDEKGRITWCNRAAASTAGYAPDDLRGMELSDLGAEKERQKLRKLLEQALARGRQIQREEVVVARPDGRRFWAELTLLPIQGNGSGGAGVEGMLRDVTERKMNEAIRAILSGERAPAHGES